MDTMLAIMRMAAETASWLLLLPFIAFAAMGAISGIAYLILLVVGLFRRGPQDVTQYKEPHEQ